MSARSFVSCSRQVSASLIRAGHLLQKTFATEAAEALVAYAFQHPQVSTVRARTFAQGNASARVLMKCGFTSVGEVNEPDDGIVWRWERGRE